MSYTHRPLSLETVGRLALRNIVLPSDHFVRKSFDSGFRSGPPARKPPLDTIPEDISGCRESDLCSSSSVACQQHAETTQSLPISHSEIPTEKEISPPEGERSSYDLTMPELITVGAHGPHEKESSSDRCLSPSLQSLSVCSGSASFRWARRVSIELPASGEIAVGASLHSPCSSTALSGPESLSLPETSASLPAHGKNPCSSDSPPLPGAESKTPRWIRDPAWLMAPFPPKFVSSRSNLLEIRQTLFPR